MEKYGGDINMPSIRAKMVSGLFNMIGVNKMLDKQGEDFENLLSSYIMGIYFIAMNRCTGLSPEDNYKILESSLKKSSMFRKGLGTAEAYLDEKYIPRRLKWAEESKRRKNENNWVLDVLPRCEEYDLGYDYHECGICKICKDEGCTKR